MPNVFVKFNSRKVLKAASRSIDKPLDKAALMIERKAKILLSIGGGSAKTPSSPPRPPHLQTGNLRASIAWEAGRKGRLKSRLIGPRKSAFYGKIHEFGLAGYPKRVFMATALRNTRSRILPLFKGFFK